MLTYKSSFLTLKISLFYSQLKLLFLQILIYDYFIRRYYGLTYHLSICDPKSKNFTYERIH
uniref:Uncharacterized protein n=1 Tax=Lepeophtheirus salmonis TaxID=72036 RepID=A0A0K2UQ08_LEPSM